MKAPAVPAFQAYGIELEYMIVARDSLAPLPVADRLLQSAGGVQRNEVERGLLGWSNELVMHVVEVKNLHPVSSLEVLPAAFQTEVAQINERLDALGAVLMPGAMHPWMDPARESRLWPHDNADLYRAYAGIFDCNTHGWANLQSMHINLPFAGDAEFARLHAAIRLALPILPALAASSPYADGRDTGFADFRMEAYRTNAREFGSIAGRLVPEPVASQSEYENAILAPMYRDIAPHDPDGLLQYEWLNSRGAIARFDRNTIEIRVLDTQECVVADFAIAAATIALVMALYRAAGSRQTRPEIGTDALAAIMLSCIRDGEQAAIADRDYLAVLGYPGARCSAQQLWRHLAEVMQADGLLPNVWRQPLRTILNRGPLARRLLQAVGATPTRSNLEQAYRRLCGCLQQGRMFES